MAVRHGYGKVAGTDALVFAYDTGDTVNSYKGRPTANYGPADFANWTPEAGTAGDTAERIPTGNYYKGQPTYNCRVDTTQQYRGIYKTITDLATIAGTGGTITVSCMVKNNNSRTDQYINAFIGHDFSSVRWVAANSDWQKVQWTVDAANLNNNTVEFRPVTRVTDEYLEMTMPMVEVNVGSASQFVNGTRSVSGSLLDLTGNSTIDLTNTGFDSDAQMVFDGTNNSAAITGLTISAQQDKSYEAIIRVPVGHNQTGTIIGGQQNTSNVFQIQSNEIIRAGEDDEFIFASSSISVGEWHHVAYTFEFDGTDAYQKLYLDGEITSERTKTTFIDTYVESTQYLGYEYRFNEYFNGDIAVCKVYNRALTADEVRNNYRHYKNRFNI